MQLRHYILDALATTLHLPPGAIVRAVGLHENQPAVYVELVPVAKPKLQPRTFVVIGCEPELVPDGAVYVGSFEMWGGAKRVFVYEIPSER